MDFGRVGEGERAGVGGRGTSVPVAISKPINILIELIDR